jgi:hypothetical protein
MPIPKRRSLIATSRLALTTLFMLALVAVLFLTAASALAATPQFGETGEAAGQLNQPNGLAIDNSGEPLVDPSAGDVYVLDRNNSRVDKFAPEGKFLLAWGWGVADGKSEFEQCGPAASSPSACETGIAGAGGGQFEAAGGLAVDSNPLSASHGDVYVEDIGNHRVEKFTEDGKFLLAWGWGVADGKKEAETCGPETSTVTCKAGLEPGEPPGEPGELLPLSPNAIAVDSAGTVYVGDEGRIQEFSEAGVFERQITLAGLEFIEAVAVDAAKNVYVISGASGVHEYEGCAVTCPGKELGPPRDASGRADAIALGPSGNLFVNDRFEGTHHILEYDSSGVELASFDPSGGQSEGEAGIGFGDTVKELHVINQEENVVRLVSPPAAGPLVSSESSSKVEPTTASVEATFNPEGHPESSTKKVSYHFEYGETKSYGASTPSETLTGGSFEDRHVIVPLTGLKPRTEYHFRVVVTNAANETTDGPDQTFITLPPVLIESESVSQVSATSARFATAINALGSPTEYRFEYGRSVAYESSVPAPDANAGSAVEPVSLNVLVEGLSPATTYHYRVVAHNPLGQVIGPDHTFSTQGAETSGLIDGRAWEMVSPPEKHGASLEMSTEEGGVIQAAEDGSGLAYFAEAPIDSSPAGSRSFAYTQLLSKREASGWSTKDIATPQEAVVALRPGSLTEYRLFSSDLSVGLVEPEGATPLSPPRSEAERGHQERTPYLHESSSGEYLPLLTAANVAPGVKFGGVESALGEGFANGVEFVTATPDFSHLLLVSPVALTKGFESHERQSVYEWSGGALQLISILPDGTPAAQANQPAGVGASSLNVRNALSANGTRVVFESAPEGEVHLYLRDTAVGKTAQLDAVEAGVKRPGNNDNPIYMDASSDGSKVFFVDEQRLTGSAQATSDLPDLYMCEIVEAAGKLTCRLKDLTVPLNAGEHANVLGADIGTDEAGRYIYFVASGVLSGEANAEGEKASSGGDNLYVFDTVAGEAKFIAGLNGADAPDWHAGSFRDQFSELTSRVSANGRYLAFMSQQSLTGYDNRDEHRGKPDEEVFLYHAPEDLATESGALTCVSCNPTGARPHGVFDPNYVQPPHELPLLVDRPQVWNEKWLAGSLPGWPLVNLQHALYEPRNLSNSGRLFFDSSDGLVPQDVNGKEDVYEFEPNGIGSCRLATGCVALISAGTSSEESAFLDASGKGPGGQEGEDVFFMTASKLVPQDLDGALDVYDAHVCSSVSPCPVAAVTVPPACTTSDSCRTAPALQPEIFGAPASGTFSGPGNAAPPPPVVTKKTVKCKKNQVRKHNKCVKRPKAEKRAKKASNHRSAER